MFISECNMIYGTASSDAPQKDARVMTAHSTSYWESMAPGLQLLICHSCRRQSGCHCFACSSSLATLRQKQCRQAILKGQPVKHQLVKKFQAEHCRTRCEAVMGDQPQISNCPVPEECHEWCGSLQGQHEHKHGPQGLPGTLALLMNRFDEAAGATWNKAAPVPSRCCKHCIGACPQGQEHQRILASSPGLSMLSPREGR